LAFDGVSAFMGSSTTDLETAMTSTLNTAHLDALGQRLGHEALATLVRLCPEIREATPERQEAACAAMRAKAGEALDELLADAKDAPWLAHVAFTTAVLTLAHEGIRVIKGA
jgi:hypothetical protein